MIECGRCGSAVDRAYPLDAVVHPYTSAVCEDCVEPWDEVVDV